MPGIGVQLLFASELCSSEYQVTFRFGGSDGRARLIDIQKRKDPHVKIIRSLSAINVCVDLIWPMLPRRESPHIGA